MTARAIGPFRKEMTMELNQAKGLKRVVAGLLVALMATVAVTGWAQPPQRGPRGDAPMLGGPGMFLMGKPEHIDRMVDRLLDGVDATDAQRQQVKQIAQAAAKDVRAQLDAGKDEREQGRALFTAPKIDEAAIEALRRQAMARHEAVSRRVNQALVDAAQVLTPKQREQLAARMDKRRPPSGKPGKPGEREPRQDRDGGPDHDDDHGHGSARDHEQGAGRGHDRDDEQGSLATHVPMT